MIVAHESKHERYLTESRTNRAYHGDGFRGLSRRRSRLEVSEAKVGHLQHKRHHTGYEDVVSTEIAMGDPERVQMLQA